MHPAQRMYGKVLRKQGIAARPPGESRVARLDAGPKQAEED